MPNWCSNDVNITGPVEIISEIWETASTGDGLLSALVPQPENLFRESVTADQMDKLAEQGIPNWYTWQIGNWGTKWDVSLEGLEFTDHGNGNASINGWFESAWSPPIEAYDRFIEREQDCTIEASFHEPGMDFAGMYDNGDLEEMSGLYNEFKLPEDERSELYNRLDEIFNLNESFEMYDQE